MTTVIGGQFGSEGKGKVAHQFARDQNATVAVRVGGANSGHTVIDQNGSARILRHLPTAAILPDTLCVIAPGSYIDPDVLLSEINLVGLDTGRLVIDPNAYVITDRDRQEERAEGLRERIGSTLSGTGAAVRRRISRVSRANLAYENSQLLRYISNTRFLMRERLKRGERIVIEGTQGFGLSLLHSEHYPNVTSRDTTAAAFVSEAGLSPLDVDEVIMVLRAFPIRVAGNSGDLPNEIDWSTIVEDGRHASPIIEYSSVSRNVRRVARFDPVIVKSAIEANVPTKIVLNHVDYVDAACANSGCMSIDAMKFVRWVAMKIGQKIDYIGLSPSSLISASQPKNSDAIAK